MLLATLLVLALVITLVVRMLSVKLISTEQSLSKKTILLPSPRTKSETRLQEEKQEKARKDLLNSFMEEVKLEAENAILRSTDRARARAVLQHDLSFFTRFTLFYETQRKLNYWYRAKIILSDWQWPNRPICISNTLLEIEQMTTGFHFYKL